MRRIGIIEIPKNHGIHPGGGVIAEPASEANPKAGNKSDDEASATDDNVGGLNTNANKGSDSEQMRSIQDDDKPSSVKEEETMNIESFGTT